MFLSYNVVHLRGTYEGSVFFEDDVNFEFGEGMWIAVLLACLYIPF